MTQETKACFLALVLTSLLPCLKHFSCLQNKKDGRMNVTVTVRLQLIDCAIAIYCEITGIIQVKRNSDVRPDQLRLRKNNNLGSARSFAVHSVVGSKVNKFINRLLTIPWIFFLFVSKQEEEIQFFWELIVEYCFGFFSVSLLQSFVE